MRDQDSPWKDLPPAPPGVPDQSPKPSGAPPPRSPADDPWARPPGWQPPTPRRRGAAGTGATGQPSPLRKLLLGFGAFLVISTCIRTSVDVFPDFDEPASDTPAPASSPGPDDVPAEPRPFRIERDGPVMSPVGWFRYAAVDGSFSLVGPGRPTQDVSDRGGRWTFRSDGVALVAEVHVVRRGGGRQRTTLDRETAIFLDDLGALEQARRWTGFGDDLELDVEARRGDTRMRIHTFLADRRLFRASAEWEGTLAPEAAAEVDAFLAGLAVA